MCRLLLLVLTARQSIRVTAGFFPVWGVYLGSLCFHHTTDGGWDDRAQGEAEDARRAAWELMARLEAAVRGVASSEAAWTQAKEV